MARLKRGRIPGAIWDPIKGRSIRGNKPVRMTVHIAVARSDDIYGPQKGPGGTYAGAYSPKSGRMRQHQGIHRKTYADLDGNGHTFSVEHEGWPGDHLTANQIDNDARLFAHLVTHYGVPNRVATWDDTRGLAWHRLGCKGNFGAFSKSDRTTWSASQTGQRWSTAYGKTCPTDNYIRQIPEIYERAQHYIAGGAPAGGSPGGSSMDEKDVWKYRGYDYANPESKTATTKDHQTSRAHQYALNIWGRIRDNEWREWIARGVWGRRSTIDYVNNTGKDPWRSTQAHKLSRAHQYSLQGLNEIRAVRKAVEALAKAQGEHIEKAVVAALEEADKRVVQAQIDITVADREDNDTAGDTDPSDNIPEGEK